MCVRASTRASVRPSQAWHLLISRKPYHLEGWILARRQIETCAMLCWGQRPQFAPCAWRETRPCVFPSQTWHLLISQNPEHLEGWILARSQIEPWAMLCWGRRPQFTPCALHSARYHNFVNISKSRPFRGLNFGTRTDLPVGHTLPRPAYAEREARGSSAKREN